MSKLEDMMDHYELKDDAVIPADSLEADEKTRILNRTLEKAGLTKPAASGASGAADRSRRLAAGRTDGGAKEGRRPRRRMFPVAIACVLVLAMATISFAAIAMDKNFFTFFHADRPDQKEILGSIGTLIDKQVSDNGLTIDVREAVGDGNTVNVLFNVIAPEGTVLDQDYYTFSSAFVSLPKDPAGGASYSFAILPDDNPSDNKLTMMLCYDTDRNLSGNTMRFQFSDLTTPKSMEEMEAIDKLPPRDEPGTPGDEYDYNKVIVSGNWDIEFPLNYTDASTIVKPDASLELYGGECVIKQLRYSPISVSLVVEGDAIARYNSMPPALPGEGGEVDGDGADPSLQAVLIEGESGGDETSGFAGTTDTEVVVKLKDGSTVPTNGTGTNIEGNKLVVTCSFSELINPTDIASVSLNGVEIPLP